MIPFDATGNWRTPAEGRSHANIIKSYKKEHSKKPDELVVPSIRIAN
jgi:hypothetical protein